MVILTQMAKIYRSRFPLWRDLFRKEDKMTLMYYSCPFVLSVCFFLDTPRKSFEIYSLVTKTI